MQVYRNVIDTLTSLTVVVFAGAAWGCWYAHRSLFEACTAGIFGLISAWLAWRLAINLNRRRDYRW